MNERLRNEHAAGLARRLVEVIRPALREEEIRDCFAEFLALIQEGLGSIPSKVAETSDRAYEPILNED